MERRNEGMKSITEYLVEKGFFKYKTISWWCPICGNIFSTEGPSKVGCSECGQMQVMGYHPNIMGESFYKTKYKNYIKK
jgi:hypothetical protein